MGMTHGSAESGQRIKRGRLTDHGSAEALPPLRRGFCDFCGLPIPKAARARNARFCSAACRQAWWVVARNRGAQLYQLLLIWRSTRGRRGTLGAGMITRISRMIDHWTQADRSP